MTPQELDSISKFVSDQGKADLFAYFELSRDADQTAVDAAVRNRRAWAQGQQSNPKYRQTAIWLIKNVALCKRALGPGRPAYLQHIQAAAQAESLDVLGNVMDGAVYNRVLSEEREDAVFDRAVQLGLPDSVVEAFIEAYLDRHEAQRQAPSDFVDLYELLGIPNTADRATIEKAVARSLEQAQGARREQHLMRREIRRAARILRSTDLRSDYDREWLLLAAAVPGLASPNEPEAQLAPPTLVGLSLKQPEDAETEAFSVGGLSLKSSAPPAPRDLSGKTLAASSTTGSIRRPTSHQFQIEGDAQREIRVGRVPESLELVVQAVGEAKLQGRIISDRSWLSVTPDRLDPEQSEQTITVTVDPAGLTRSRAVALITVISDRGLRKSVTIVAERKGIKPQWLALGGAAVLAGGLVVAWPQVSAVVMPPPPPPPPQATVNIQVDPNAGEVYIDDQLITAGGSARGIRSLPVGKPVMVRVILDGFQTWEQEFTFGDGETVDIQPTLSLADPMDYDPDAEAIRGSMDNAAVSAAITGLSKEIQACISEHEPGDERNDRPLEIVSHVLAEGHIGSVAFNGKQVPTTGAAYCIRRQLRALRVPIFQGDFDVSHDKFIVSYPVPESSPK